MTPRGNRQRHVVVILEEIFNLIHTVCAMAIIFITAVSEVEKDNYWLTVDNSPVPYQTQLDHLNRLIHNEVQCHEQLRVSRRVFMILCTMVRNTGLSDSRHVVLEEKIAMFLNVIGHDLKNRNIKFVFMRSGETVSRHFNDVLRAVLRLHGTLLKAPEPVTAHCQDDQWKWFQNCLGALDGTYVKVNVSVVDRPRYRTRKGFIATNVLGVCSQDMQFIYVLSGWEGSASDSRVLRDAIHRPHGLRVPIGFYYLVDGGYTNGEGFLAPYRGQRYHLSTWRDGPYPQSPEEFLNMKHASSRNVIERCFGLLKMRWTILRNGSYYPIKTQNRIIIACCLIHNLLRREMSDDPLEAQLDDYAEELGDTYIDQVEPTDQWTDWRTTLANHMFNKWQHNRNTY